MPHIITATGRRIEINSTLQHFPLREGMLSLVDAYALFELYRAGIEPVLPLMSFNPNSQGMEDVIQVASFFTGLTDVYLRGLAYGISDWIATHPADEPVPTLMLNAFGRTSND